MHFATFCFLLTVSVSGLAQSPVVEFSAPPKFLDVKLVDARDRDSWLQWRLPQSVYLDWDHFSQPGVGSRGSLREDPQIIADDLARAGLNKNDIVFVFGNGSKGRANEGRLAWMFYWLGFKKIYVSDFKTARLWAMQALERGPYEPKATSKWRVSLREDLLLPLATYRKWRSDAAVKKKNPHVLIDLRGLRALEPMPGVNSPADLSIFWGDFLDHPQETKKQIEDYIKTLRLESPPTIIPMSFAGLRSSYIALVLKSWGFKSKFVSEGYSIDLGFNPVGN